MPLFIILATIAFIILLYSLFNSVRALLDSKKAYFDILSLNEYSDTIKINTKSNGMLITEISEIKNQDVREAILKDFPLPIYIFSGITGRGKHANPAFERLLGYTLKEIPTIFKCMQLIFPNENYRRYIKNELKKICEEGKKTKSIFRSIEVYAFCKDGSKKCISMGCISKGNLKWYYAYNVTSSNKKTEIPLNREYKSNNLDTNKNKVFSIIAHDLRSPFNTILGCSELIFQNIKENETEEAMKYAQLIEATAKNSIALIDNLLHWSKFHTQHSSFNPQRIILTTVISEIIELYSSAAITKEIEIIHLKPDNSEIYTDVEMLKTILRNLVSNAIKFTKIGGKIRVVYKKENNKVIITISDNGIGIGEKNIDKLFNIETNKWSFGTSSEKGSGFGLPLCYEFIKKLGGNISVESKEGVGSEFKLTLPLTLEIVGGLTHDILIENI